MKDPIVEETRAAREGLLKRFDYDLEALVAHLEQQETLGKKAVILKPKRPSARRLASQTPPLMLSA